MELAVWLMTQHCCDNRQDEQGSTVEMGFSLSVKSTRSKFHDILSVIHVFLYCSKELLVVRYTERSLPIVIVT